MKLKEYTFGFADSETEFVRNPEIFKTAFYDPQDILNKLLDGNQFILIGNKGVGKTAYSAKIRSLVDENENLNAHQVSLANFEFGTFATLSREDFSGSQKFKQAWDLTLLIEVYKFLNEISDYSSVESFYNIIQFLKSNNLMTIDSINTTVMSFNGLELAYKDFIKLVLGKKVNSIKDYSIKGLIDYFQKGLKDIDFNSTKSYLIIDGLDDILRYEKTKIEILSGLFRSIKHLNDYFYINRINIKIIILAREDILSSITDPDFNKIKRDEGISIAWDNNHHLMEMLKLRFQFSGLDKDKLDNCWTEIFPEKINKQSTFIFVLEHTLSRPRDLLQFLVQCQREFPNLEKINHSQLKYVLGKFSSSHFYEEMKNELTGFIKDADIEKLALVFTDLGTTDFSYRRFTSVANKYFVNKNEEYLIKVFNILFDNGYLGQIIESPDYDKKKKKQIIKTRLKFKHRNPNLTINLNNKFTLHRGLYKALNLENN